MSPRSFEDLAVPSERELLEVYKIVLNLNLRIKPLIISIADATNLKESLSE